MNRLSQKSKILAYMKSGKKITPAIAQCLRSLSDELTELREYIEKIAEAIGLDMRFWKEKGSVEIVVCISDLLKSAKENSVEITELRRAKESLDWLIEHKGTHLWNRYMLDNCPPYLKSRLERGIK